MIRTLLFLALYKYRNDLRKEKVIQEYVDDMEALFDYAKLLEERGDKEALAEVEKQMLQLHFKMLKTGSWRK